MSDLTIEETIDLTAIDPGELPVERVGLEICRLAGQIAAATSRFLRFLADFDARRGWASSNIKSCTQWLSWRCGLDLRTAREHLRVAHALTELPKIRDSFDAGRISYSKVRAISRVARLAPEDGARLLAAATRMSLELDRSVSPSTANAELLDPAGHQDDVAASKSDPQSGAESGSAEPSAFNDGQALTTRPPYDLGPALVAMAEMTCTGLTAPAHAPAADVLVTVDINAQVEAFANVPTSTEDTSATSEDAPAGIDPARKKSLHNGARLDDGPHLTAATLRRLADDGHFRFALNAADRRTIDLGRARRTPNSAQLRALWRRDHGCTVPGCGRIRFLHAHHVMFWTNGGATDLDNLVLLCGEHHRALHEGRFTITALGRQRFRFTGPAGTELDPAPSMSGRAEDLIASHSEVEPDTIAPDWDGPSGHTFTISEYLANWTQMIRRNRKQQEMAS
jgi:hypothetical protein